MKVFILTWLTSSIALAGGVVSGGGWGTAAQPLLIDANDYKRLEMRLATREEIPMIKNPEILVRKFDSKLIARDMVSSEEFELKAK